MTPERALELIELYKWKNGGCIIIGNKKPDVEPESESERREIIDLWDTMPGYTCYNDALYRIVNNES